MPPYLLLYAGHVYERRFRARCCRYVDDDDIAYAIAYVYDKRRYSSLDMLRCWRATCRALRRALCHAAAMPYIIA